MFKQLRLKHTQPYERLTDGVGERCARERCYSAPMLKNVLALDIAVIGTAATVTRRKPGYALHTGGDSEVFEGMRLVNDQVVNAAVFPRHGRLTALTQRCPALLMRH